MASRQPDIEIVVEPGRARKQWLWALRIEQTIVKKGQTVGKPSDALAEAQAARWRLVDKMVGNRGFD